MKKLYHILFAAIAILCVTTVQSCTNKKTEPIHKISVSDSEIAFGVMQEQKTFTITSKINWNITAEGLNGTDGGWYTISSASGSYNTEITVEAKANDTGKQRIAILTVKGKYNWEPVTITQAADGSMVLEVDKTSLSFTVVPAKAETFNVTAAAFGFEITTKDELPEPQPEATPWYTITPMQADSPAEISVVATPNGTGVVRSVTIVVKSPSGKLKEINVEQAADGPMVLEVDKTSLSFTVVPAKAETFNVTAAAFGFEITTKDELPEPLPEATPWYTIAPMQADSPAEISVVATPNGTGVVRSVTIVVKSPSGKLKEINVEQAADGDGMLDVAPSALTEFEVANAPTQTFTITSPFEWTITFEDKTIYTDPLNPAIDPQWANVDVAEGEGDKTITVTAKDNTTSNPRTGEFTITAAGKIKTVTVSQLSDLNNTFDPKFLAWCLDPAKGNVDTNGEGLISAAEAEAATKIDCSAQNLESIKGVENFTNLTSLSCYDNKLTELNLSANTKLTSLACGNNQLTELNLSANRALETLFCRGNLTLATIDISGSSFEKLTGLHCTNIKVGVKFIVWSGFSIADKPAISTWEYDEGAVWQPVP